MGIDERVPLSALLSRTLVAFTIELHPAATRRKVTPGESAERELSPHDTSPADTAPARSRRGAAHSGPQAAVSSRSARSQFPNSSGSPDSTWMK